jgi:outer membrane protein TolC
MLVASIPIFDGGVRYGQLRDRRARLRQARLNQEALERTVASEVRQAYRAWQTALTTVEISARQLQLAQDAHRLALAAYEAGAASNLEVVDAQRALANAEVNVELQRLGAQLSLIQLLASLEVSVGGFGAQQSGAPSEGMSGGAPSGAGPAGEAEMGGGAGWP